KLRVTINEEKSRMVDLSKGEKFSFLGFEFRRILSRNKKWRPYFAPKLKKRTGLLATGNAGAILPAAVLVVSQGALSTGGANLALVGQSLALSEGSLSATDAESVAL